MASAFVESMTLDTQVPYAERSETPSPTGPLRFASPGSYQLSGASSQSSPMSTTWLKLNSNGPIRVQVEPISTEALDAEPFAGAKKLRYLLDHTDELVVCPGVYDGLSARTAIELGFKSLYMVSDPSPPFFFCPFPSLPKQLCPGLTSLDFPRIDRCRNHGLETRATRPRHCATSRYEGQCRHDRQS